MLKETSDHISRRLFNLVSAFLVLVLINKIKLKKNKTKVRKTKERAAIETAFLLWVKCGGKIKSKTKEATRVTVVVVKNRYFFI